MSANLLSFSITYDRNNKKACNSEISLVINTKPFSNSLFESEAVSIFNASVPAPLFFETKYNTHMGSFCYYIMRL